MLAVTGTGSGTFVVTLLMEDAGMKAYDVSPLFRSTVGFDRLIDMLDQASKVDQMTNWPPYNIEKLADDRYQITLALAGFGADEIELTQHDTSLLISGRKKDAADDRTYMHRGIAGRTFHHTFNLAEHVKVVGADLDNGLLAIDLFREVPEALKPRRIEIGATPSSVQQDSVHQDNAPKQLDQPGDRSVDAA